MITTLGIGIALLLSGAAIVSIIVIGAFLLLVVMPRLHNLPAPFVPVARATYLAECGCTVEALTPIDLVEVADEHIHECGMAAQEKTP
jgi:hypothetical protein